MFKHMRTTIRIDDDLYRRAKTRAAREGRTVGFPVYGGSGLLPGVDLGARSALIDLMDGPAPVDVLR